MLTINEYKSRGKAYLEDNWVEVIIATLIFMITTLISGGLRVSTRSPREDFGIGLIINFRNMLQWVIAGPLQYGYIVFIKALRTKDAHLGQMFEGFKRFFDTFLLHVIRGIIVTLFTLLLIIPGIIAAISLSMAFLILQDNPDMTALQAIEESRFLMQGNKMRFFEFQISFIGWFILGVLTLGIGFLYLNPYYKSAKIEFYEDLKRLANQSGYEVNY